MANGVDFQGANMVMQAPKGAKNCVDLPIFNDNKRLISCWRLTPDELKEIAETGVVWLAIEGQKMSPVYVSGKALVNIDGLPSKAEPILPNKPMKDRQ